MKRTLFLIAICVCFCVGNARADQRDSTTFGIVRSIRIDGNSVTQPYVILREMSLHAGDTLTQASLVRDQDRIYNLGLFNKVVITHRDSAETSELFVSVVERWYIFPIPILNLRTRAANTASYGLGAIHQNFLGRNERLSASFMTGYDHSAGLTYQTPRIKDDDDIFLRAQYQYRDSHSLDYNSDIVFEQINRTGSVSLGKRFGYYQTLIGTAGYQTWQLPDTSLGRTVSPDGTDRFLELGLNYTYDARDVREYPTDGWYLDVSATQDGLGHESTLNNLRLVNDLRWYTLLSDNLTFAARGFGSLVAGGAVPMYHRVFLNNRLGIRGYNQRDYTGEDLLGASLEVRMPLIQPRFVTFNFFNIYQFNTMRFGIYAAAFMDAGKIWFRSDTFGNVPWLASSGVGIHFLLPYSFILRTELSINAIGQVRLAANGGVSF
ncbi:MAG TPA: BamA/TamA family outer membrane protein [Bacteroidota bacterium]|nr:BamA/TamA family outer membrane protein [Bacteroidota bacterium]